MPALHRPLCLSASSAWRSSTIAVELAAFERQAAVSRGIGRVHAEHGDRGVRAARLASSRRVNVAGSSSGVSP